MMEKPRTNELKREVGLATGVLFVIGSSIGSGVFMAPQNMASSSTPGVSIVAWIICALGTMLVALSFANLGTKIPATGGCVEYTRTAFGEFPAHRKIKAERRVDRDLAVLFHHRMLYLVVGHV